MPLKALFIFQAILNWSETSIHTGHYPPPNESTKFLLPCLGATSSRRQARHGGGPAAAASQDAPRGAPRGHGKDQAGVITW